jgi:hypothetical protein
MLQVMPFDVWISPVVVHIRIYACFDSWSVRFSPDSVIPGQDLVASCFDGGRWKIDHTPEVDHRGGKMTALGQRGWLVTARLAARTATHHTHADAGGRRST